MNTKQLKWIYKKALFLLEKYGEREVGDEEWQEIISYAQKVYEDTKRNEYCKDIMQRSVNAIDNDDKEKRLDSAKGETE